MSRNRRPRGHIERRGPDSFRLWVPLGTKPDGTYDWHRESFRGTEDDAQKRLTSLLNQMDTNRLAKSGTMTFGEYMETWLADYVDANTKPGTASAYRSHAKIRIIPTLGNVRLSELSPLHIRRFFNKLRDEGRLSLSTIRKVRVIVRQALIHAVDDGLIPSNPAQSVKLPPPESREKRLWTWDELQRFLAAADGDPQKALIYTLAFTGMRVSEVLALRWSRINFNERLIEVKENLHRAGPAPIFTTPKSGESRFVPIADELYPVLRQHRSEQNSVKLAMGGEWNPHDVVFPNERGNPIHRQNFLRRTWQPLIEEINERAAENGDPPLPYINVHGLRHTFATLLLQWDADDKAVSEMLGHHSVEYTKDEYYHPEMDVHRSAISHFSRARKSGTD